MKIDLKSVISDVKTENDLAVPKDSIIEVGKFDTVLNETIREEEKSRVSSLMIDRLQSKDYSKTSRLTKLTPLMVAAMNKNHKACQLLIDHAKNTKKWKSTKMSMFLNMQLVDRKGGNNPLLFACDHGDYILFEYLVKSGADVNVANNQGQTPLIIATKRNYLSIINLLLDNKDTDINKVDKNKMNAFSFA